MSTGPSATPAEDAEDMLLKQPIVLLKGPMNDDSVTKVIAKLLFLNYQDGNATVQLWIDSPGGSFTGALAITDTMDHIRPRVHTRCTGQACGAALLVVIHGARGYRSAAAHAQLLFTRLWSRESGEKAAQQLEKDRLEFISRVVQDSQLTPDQVSCAMEGERWITSQDACDLGIIDYVEKTC